MPGFTGFAEIPQIRKPGDYPYKEGFEKIASLMTVVTLLALLSGLVLLSNTMSTLIGEQTGEIAAMKAIGARRRDIRRIYRRTALMLGALGGTIGVVLGLVLANVLTGFFAQPVLRPRRGVPRRTRRARGERRGRACRAAAGGDARRPPRLAAAGARGAAGQRARRSAVRGAWTRSCVGSRSCRAAPRSGCAASARRKRRTLATASQVALAVGALLALLALGTSVGKTTNQYYDDLRFDVFAGTVATRPFSAESARVMAATRGVARIQPLLSTSGKAAGKDVMLWGTADRPLIERAGERRALVHAGAGARARAGRRARPPARRPPRRRAG